ncbi:MAG: DUF3788 domain-containing protein [Christensenellaceae bacterium]|jgi:hypothetical protein|nr:DUF3788 domain-containing protein [Christensenellaceae bacterium]
MKDEKPILNNPDIYPTNEVLAQTLGTSFDAYIEFTDRLPQLNIEPEWRYYNDGKYWLSKGLYKNKTIFWLSIWEGGYFKITFYFNKKTRGGVQNLKIADSIKQTLANASPVARLYPLLLYVRNTTALYDIFKLIEYKKSIK